MKFHYDYEGQEALLPRGMTSLKRKLSMLYMFALIRKKFLNAIYKVDVRPFIIAALSC